MVKKISIIGAGGVGSTLAFSILNRIPPQELVLVDICPGLAKGTALDLEDTRGFLKFTTRIQGSTSYNPIKNSGIVVITAGVPRKKGMTRLDLLKINLKIARAAAHNIKRLAPKAIVITVTNPLDLVTYTVVNQTGFSRRRVIGMGSSLDTSRLFNILHNFSGMEISTIKGCVYGPHSKNMIVNPAAISVKAKSLAKLFPPGKFLALKRRVQNRGAAIVGCLQNRSAHFAPGLAAAVLVEAVSKNANVIMPVSVLLKGEYGLRDVCLGVPCRINAKGVSAIIEMKLSPGQTRKLKEAEKAFKECMI